MASHMKRAAAALGVTGTRGSWARRIAENATVIDGVTVGELGTRSSWMGRLAAGMGRTSGRGGWALRAAGMHTGRSPEEAFAEACESGGGSESDVLAEDGSPIELEGGGNILTET